MLPDENWENCFDIIFKTGNAAVTLIMQHEVFLSLYHQGNCIVLLPFGKKKERETNLQILPLICFLPVEKLGQGLSQSMSAASTALLQKSTYILMPLNDMQLGSTIFWNSEQTMGKIKEGIQK